MSPANLFTVTCHTKWSRSGPSVYSFENGLDKYWKSELIKFKYDAKPPGFDPANLKRRRNLELNIEA